MDSTLKSHRWHLRGVARLRLLLAMLFLGISVGAPTGCYYSEKEVRVDHDRDGRDGRYDGRRHDGRHDGSHDGHRDGRYSDRHRR